ncbi:MAG: type II toxin-antitoxin system Phd/YefM family antitoxin [Planctomycetota bacterium]
MSCLTVQQAQADLPAVIADLKAGEVVIITDDGKPVARLTPEPQSRRERRQLGSAVGRLTILSEDDEHLDDFGDYMP